jgi:RNA polymerase sigma-70 factor (ECF subfamily)
MNPERSTDAWVDDAYRELRAIAHRYLSGERSSYTLQTTALVHEAYVRLSPNPSWRGRAEFLAASSRIMREILIDHARARSRLKRGGGNSLRITLDELQMAIELPDEVDVLAVDEALRRLERLDARQARIVEMRFFAGMSIEEVSKALNVASKTINRDWAMARAWLRRELGGNP